MQSPVNRHHRGKTFLAARSLGLALLCSILVIGCEQIRKTTYPQDFVYLEQKKITSEMVKLSLHMRQIEQILAEETTISSEQQAQIIKILVSIDDTANRLGAGSVRTNHLVLDDHIDDFKRDVTSALRDASADPPNYYALGRLAGSCVGCHKYRNF